VSSLITVERLTSLLTLLPGVGRKTAQRYAYRIINLPETQVLELCDALMDVKRRVRYCDICGNYTDKKTCDLCNSRNNTTICVVKEPKDVLAFERVRDYSGGYHVLHGVLDPLNNVGPDDIGIALLMKRLSNVKEVIIATSTDTTGEATAQYLARLIKPMGIIVSRIGSGIPMNSDIEYADDLTLSRALTDRKIL